MVIKTRYGTLDEIAFESFRDDFDTDRILRAVRELSHIADGITTLQDTLREMHLMAEELIGYKQYGYDAHVPDSETIWMLAEEIITSIRQWPDIIESVRDIADEVACLAPDETEWVDPVE